MSFACPTVNVHFFFFFTCDRKITARMWFYVTNATSVFIFWVLYTRPVSVSVLQCMDTGPIQRNHSPEVYWKLSLPGPLISWIPPTAPTGSFCCVGCGDSGNQHFWKCQFPWGIYIKRIWTAFQHQGLQERWIFILFFLKICLLWKTFFIATGSFWSEPAQKTHKKA